MTRPTPSPKKHDLSELAGLPPAELIRRIIALEERLALMRLALAAERRAADRWHDRAVRLANPNGLRIADGDERVE